MWRDLYFFCFAPNHNLTLSMSCFKDCLFGGNVLSGEGKKQKQPRSVYSFLTKNKCQQNVGV